MDLPLYDVSLFWSLSDRSRVEYMYKFKSLYIQANRPKGNADPVSSSRLVSSLSDFGSLLSLYCLAGQTDLGDRSGTPRPVKAAARCPTEGRGWIERERERGGRARSPHTEARGLDSTVREPRRRSRRGEARVPLGPNPICLQSDDERREERSFVSRVSCFIHGGRHGSTNEHRG